MKKNKMLRLASVLLVCVLASTSIIGGTFAKYTTSAEYTQHARVAKWGLGATATEEFNLFKAVYQNTDGKETVKSTENVIAPGTSNEQKLLTITGGAPEVAYSFTVALDAKSNADENAASTTIAKLDELEGFNWTLKKPSDTEAAKYSTFEQLQEAVRALSQETVEVGKLPDGFTDDENEANEKAILIGWEWGFEGNEEADTAAGEAAAAGSLDTFNLKLTITATQID